MVLRASTPRGKGKPTTVSPARREAYAILLEVEKGHAHADELLRGSRVSALSQPDRNLCTTLVLGTLRWQIRLDAIISPLLARPNSRLDPEIRIALRMGAFQRLFLDRIPDHAAIGESVGLAKLAGHKFASGMVNAVLRKVATQPRPSTEVAENLTAGVLADATAHPRWMVERWLSIYGRSTARAICLHGQVEPESALRFATKETEDELLSQGIRVAPASFLSNVRLLSTGDVTQAAAFCEGRVRIQEEGSQLIAELTGNGKVILDCCAAPGGKTLILAERNPESRIVASEASTARLSAMRERLQNLPRARHLEFRQADATEAIDGDAFDLVLADVPCSGTGTLGRNPEIRHRLKLEDLTRHQERQTKILRAALRSTIVGGRVVYSTCSLEPEENEQVVSEVLREAANWKRVPLTERIDALQAASILTEYGAAYLRQCVGPDGALQLVPGELATDGFFVAILERQA